MFFNRMTNVLPRHFGMDKMFFMRVFHDTGGDNFQMDKELHLPRQHQPHGNGLYEHYCRRWLSLSLLKDLRDIQEGGKYVGTIVGAQHSKYFGTDDEYFALTLARPAIQDPNINISVTIGILKDEELPSKIRFLNDPTITTRTISLKAWPSEKARPIRLPRTLVSRTDDGCAIAQRREDLSRRVRTVAPAV